MYKYEKGTNFEIFSTGHVLYNAPGIASFPVRLASEIFFRCKKYIECSHSGPYTLCDPCCGGGSLLTSIGFIHRADIKVIIGLDIDETALSIARKNLSLVTAFGISSRINLIHDMIKNFGKESHKIALNSAKELQKIINFNVDPIIHIQNMNVFNLKDQYNLIHPDIIITDIPYNNLVSWKFETNDNIKYLSKNISSICNESTIVAIVSNEKKSFDEEYFIKIEYFKIGSRHINILRKKEK